MSEGPAVPEEITSCSDTVKSGTFIHENIKMLTTVGMTVDPAVPQSRAVKLVTSILQMLASCEVGISAMGCLCAGRSTTWVQDLDADELAWLLRLEAVRISVGCQHERPPALQSL